MSSMDLSKLDFNRLKADVTGALANALVDLVTGSAEDVQKFAAAIADDGLEAALLGRRDLLERLMDQLEVIGEINRVRAENHTWIVVQSVTKAVFSAAVAGAVSVFL